MDRSITVCALTDYTGQRKAWKYNQLTIKIHYSTILFALQNSTYLPRELSRLVPVADQTVVRAACRPGTVVEAASRVLYLKLPTDQVL